MIISRLPFGGGGGGEMHGANIIVATEEADLIGKNVDLYFGNIIVASKTFNAEGTCLFTGLQEVGEYNAMCEGIGSLAVVVTVDDIFSKNTLEIDISIRIELELGQTYSFGGYNWTCAEEIEGGYCLQSQGVTSDIWTNLFPNVTTSQDGVDCHANNTVLNTLYENIKSAEKSGAEYGSGLFLVSNAKCGRTTAGTGSGLYCSSIVIANQKYAQFGAETGSAWIGTFASGRYWTVNINGTVNNITSGAHKYVIAPSFNLDSSKVLLDGTTILVR